jgi:Flp pilus assembly protein protease CpaA
MVFRLIPLATAFIGSTLAGIWDLKTTEVPDQIPYVMIAIALIFYGIQSYLEWNYWPIVSSLTAGLTLLGLGFAMYYLGQWGGGDAKILSAMGFLLPTAPLPVKTFFPFPASYLINVFLVGAMYMLVYAFIMAMLNKKIILGFLKDMKANSKIISLGSICLFATFLVINLYLIKTFDLVYNIPSLIANSILPLILTIVLYVIWRFAKVVEDVGFKKKIPISELKVGDVLLESKLWEGLTEKDLKKIKASGKRFVYIKEGVRFAMSFPLALLFTLYFGDGILLFFRFFI